MKAYSLGLLAKEWKASKCVRFVPDVSDQIPNIACPSDIDSVYSRDQGLVQAPPTERWPCRKNARKSAFIRKK